MTDTGHDLLFKFIIIGDSGTGKSCLLRYFLDKKFKKDTEHTVGVEFGSKVVTVKDKKIKLQIWDTAGQERFKSVTRSYYRNAIGCLLVYDVTSKETFKQLAKWLHDARTLARPDLTVMIVGNKNDRKSEREVVLLDATHFAQENDCLFFETSAFTGDCVDEVFVKTAATIKDKIDSGMIDPGTLMTGVHTAAASVEQKQPAPGGCPC